MMTPKTAALSEALAHQAIQARCFGCSPYRVAAGTHPAAPIHMRASRQVKCMVATPAPDSSIVVETEVLPSYETFEDEQVVEIDGREARVFSAVNASDRVGTVIFLSGFAQTPAAYKGLLERCAAAGIVVVAPLTSTLGTSATQLQSNLVDGGAFWMDLVIENSDDNALRKYLPVENAPVGILGHSMGGGLTYSLAARFPEAKVIASMSPTPDLTDNFDPEDVIASDAFQTSKRRALVLAGGMDPYSIARNVRRDIVTPLATAFGEAAVDYEYLTFGLHTTYQDFIDFPLEDVVADLWKGGKNSEAILTMIEEFPGLLAGALFLSGLRFEMGLAGLVFAYGVVSDTPWIKWGAGGALLITLTITVVVELIKELTNQPESVSERVAKFFVDEF